MISKTTTYCTGWQRGFPKETSTGRLVEILGKAHYTGASEDIFRSLINQTNFCCCLPAQSAADLR